MADARSRLEEILRQKEAIEATEPQRMAELSEYFTQQNRKETGGRIVASGLIFGYLLELR
jgi:hypothetical protein